MASYDAGMTVGIDGESEFRSSLKSIDATLKTLGSELKAVTAEFQDNADSMEALTAKADVLQRSISENERRLEIVTNSYNNQKTAVEALAAELQRVTQEYGANSREAAQAQRIYNSAYNTLQYYGDQVNRTRTNLGNLRSQLSAVESQMEETEEATSDLGEAVDKTDSSFSSFKVMLGNLAANAITAVVSAIGDMIGSLVNLDEATEEFRIAQGRVNTAFETAGYSSDAAQQAYRDFFKILGDTDTAAEASQLLAKLADDEEDLTTWTKIAAGVSGTFGDSLPIEGLIEAANETAKVGQVTGALADALNWAGISEDDFNAKLEAASSESERNDLIMSTLAGTYDEAAAAFQRNNSALLAARDSQVSMDQSLATLGETILNIKNRVNAELNPALAGIATAFNAVLTGSPEASTAMAASIQTLIETVTSFVPQIIETGGQIVAALVNGIVQSLPALSEAAVELIPQVAVSLKERATALVETGTSLLLELTDGIVNAIPDMVEALPEIITEFVGFVSDNFDQIVCTGGQILGKLIAGILSEIPELVANLPEIISAIVSGLDRMMNSVVEAGKDIVSGLWDGISSMGTWIGERIREFGDGVLQDIKDFFGIHSPSTVMRDEVGVMLGRGVAVGLENSVTYVDQAAERIGQAIEDKILETQEALEREQTDLVKESLDTQLEALETFRNEYTDALEDLRSRQQSMAEQLSGYGDLFSWTEAESSKILDLGDLQSQINAIRDYGAALEALKARGTSESLLEEIVGLSVDDATAYTNQLLKMTDEEYASYIALWEEKQAAAADIARKFYSNELRGLEEEFIGKLPEAMRDLKSELETVGANCALGLAEGFQAESRAIQDAFVSTTQQALAAAEQAMGVHSPSTVWAGFGKNLALGLDNGFTETMDAVSARMAQAIPTPTIESINNAAAGMVNGLATIGGTSGRTVIELHWNVNGKELYRETIEDFRAVNKEIPEVLDDV